MPGSDHTFVGEIPLFRQIFVLALVCECQTMLWVERVHVVGGVNSSHAWVEPGIETTKVGLERNNLANFA